MALEDDLVDARRSQLEANSEGAQSVATIEAERNQKLFTETMVRANEGKVSSGLGNLPLDFFRAQMAGVDLTNGDIPNNFTEEGGRNAAGYDLGSGRRYQSVVHDPYQGTAAYGVNVLRNSKTRRGSAPAEDNLGLSAIAATLQLSGKEKLEFYAMFPGYDDQTRDRAWLAGRDAVRQQQISATITRESLLGVYPANPANMEFKARMADPAFQQAGRQIFKGFMGREFTGNDAEAAKWLAAHLRALDWNSGAAALIFMRAKNLDADGHRAYLQALAMWEQTNMEPSFTAQVGNAARGLLDPIFMAANSLLPGAGFTLVSAGRAALREYLLRLGVNAALKTTGEQAVKAAGQRAAVGAVAGAEAGAVRQGAKDMAATGEVSAERTLMGALAEGTMGAVGFVAVPELVAGASKGLRSAWDYFHGLGQPGRRVQGEWMGADPPAIYGRAPGDITTPPTPEELRRLRIYGQAPRQLEGPLEQTPHEAGPPVGTTRLEGGEIDLDLHTNFPAVGTERWIDVREAVDVIRSDLWRGRNITAEDRTFLTDFGHHFPEEPLPQGVYFDPELLQENLGSNETIGQQRDYNATSLDTGDAIIDHNGNVALSDADIILARPTDPTYPREAAEEWINVARTYHEDAVANGELGFDDRGNLVTINELHNEVLARPGNPAYPGFAAAQAGFGEDAVKETPEQRAARKAVEEERLENARMLRNGSFFLDAENNLHDQLGNLIAKRGDPAYPEVEAKRIIDDPYRATFESMAAKERKRIADNLAAAQPAAPEPFAPPTRHANVFVDPNIGFYSVAQKLANEWPSKRVSVPEYRVLLARGGMDPMEAVMLGLNDFLRGKESVPREALTDFIASQTIKLARVNLESNVPTTQEAAYVLAADPDIAALDARRAELTSATGGLPVNTPPELIEQLHEERNKIEALRLNLMNERIKQITDEAMVNPAIVRTLGIHDLGSLRYYDPYALSMLKALYKELGKPTPSFVEIRRLWGILDSRARSRGAIITPNMLDLYPNVQQFNPYVEYRSYAYEGPEWDPGYTTELDPLNYQTAVYVHPGMSFAVSKTAHPGDDMPAGVLGFSRRTDRQGVDNTPGSVRVLEEFQSDYEQLLARTKRHFDAQKMLGHNNDVDNYEDYVWQTYRGMIGDEKLPLKLADATDEQRRAFMADSSVIDWQSFRGIQIAEWEDPALSLAASVFGQDFMFKMLKSELVRAAQDGKDWFAWTPTRAQQSRNLARPVISRGHIGFELEISKAADSYRILVVSGSFSRIYGMEDLRALMAIVKQLPASDQKEVSKLVGELAKAGTHGQRQDQPPDVEDAEAYHRYMPAGDSKPVTLVPGRHLGYDALRKPVDRLVKRYGSKVEDVTIETTPGDREILHGFRITPEMRKALQQGIPF